MYEAIRTERRRRLPLAPTRAWVGRRIQSSSSTATTVDIGRANIAIRLRSRFGNALIRLDGQPAAVDANEVIFVPANSFIDCIVTSTDGTISVIGADTVDIFQFHDITKSLAAQTRVVDTEARTVTVQDS